MNDRFKKLYMDMALRVAAMSYAERLKVGCVIVKDHIITYGYNGTPAKWSNTCESKVWCDGGGWLDPAEIDIMYPYSGSYIDHEGYTVPGRYKLVTKPEVMHAESNAISKMAKSNQSSDGATVFLTHPPCIDCAKQIYQAGIAEVYYDTEYKNTDGIDFLIKAGVKIEKL